MFLFFQVRYAEDMGIPLSQGTWLISYLGVSSAVGRLLFGKLSDLCCHRNIQIYRACMLLSGVASFLCPMATSYVALILYVVVLGLLDGSYIGLMSIVTMDIVGLDNIAPAWGILFFCQSFFYLLGPPAAGEWYSLLVRRLHVKGIIFMHVREYSANADSALRSWLWLFSSAEFTHFLPL